jgi:hypothetical protein
MLEISYVNILDNDLGEIPCADIPSFSARQPCFGIIQIQECS